MKRKKLDEAEIVGLCRSFRTRSYGTTEGVVITYRGMMDFYIRYVANPVQVDVWITIRGSNELVTLTKESHEKLMAGLVEVAKGLTKDESKSE